MPPIVGGGSPPPRGEVIYSGILWMALVICIYMYIDIRLFLSDSGIVMSTHHRADLVFTVGVCFLSMGSGVTYIQ